MSRDRDFRLHQRARMKARAGRLLASWGNAPNPGKYADNLARCSCSMCGNPRHHFGERTLQESRAATVAEWEPGSMTECCGESGEIRFCPRCGFRLVFDPLVDLLKHCRSTESECRSRARLAQRNSLGATADWVAKQVENDGREAEKWKAWGDALAVRLGVDSASHEGRGPGP